MRRQRGKSGSHHFHLTVAAVMALAMCLGLLSATVCTTGVSDLDKVASEQGMISQGEGRSTDKDAYAQEGDITEDTQEQTVVACALEDSASSDSALEKYMSMSEDSDSDLMMIKTEYTENPLYSGEYAKNDTSSSAIEESYESTYLTSVSDETETVGALIRDAMVDRQTEFAVSYNTTEALTADHIAALFDVALEHTGVSTEGDYIRWCWKGYYCSVITTVVDDTYENDITFYCEYYTDATQEAEVTEMVTSVLDSFGFTDSTTDYEKISAIYDYVCGHVTYDYDGLADEDDYLKYTAYAALIEGTSVCQGYATLMYRMLLEAGVPVRVVAGTSHDENHSWNIVRLNGYYYNLDATWDAGLSSNAYSYFLKCDDNFTDHTRWDEYTTDDFYIQYPMDTDDYDPYANVTDDTAIVVDISEEVFPDATFRGYVQDNYDLNEDGSLSEMEITRATYMDVSSMSISSLEGVEYLTGLVTLLCEDNSLTSLDVSNLTELTGLYCMYNQITEIDVTNNEKLADLWCGSNQLSELDVSQNTCLTSLECSDNALTELNVTSNTLLIMLIVSDNNIRELNVSKCTDLWVFDCDNNQLASINVTSNLNLYVFSCACNQLTELDVSNNLGLHSLFCSDNLFTSIDVSKNCNLETLQCWYLDMTELDVSNNKNLITLFCLGNKLTSIDLSNNTELERLQIQDNQFTELDISNNTKLTYLDCQINQLTKIDLSNNPELLELYVHNNQITELDVSNNTKLTSLHCGLNQLTSLDVSANEELLYLDVDNNQLTDLDASGKSCLTTLDCTYNQLTKLDVNNDPKLVTLDCSDNQMTEFDVSNNPSLVNLDCENNQISSIDVCTSTGLSRMLVGYNQLTELDVSNNVDLIELDCGHNNITDIDLSKNSKLQYLDLDDNKLTVIDLSNNTALTKFYCSNNQITSYDFENCTSLSYVYCGGTYYVSGDILTLDLSTLPGNFDISKASNWYNATVNGNVINIENDFVHYDYDCGKGITVTFTLRFPDYHSHSYKLSVTKPTCTEGGYTTYTCIYCGKSYVSEETDPLSTTGHDYEPIITEPTCTEGGYTTYTCETCGDSYIADETEALGHTTEIQNAKEATCTEAGYTGDGICTVCGEIVSVGEIIPATDHEYEEEITKPTCTEGGYTTYTCTECGDSYIADETEALGHTTEIQNAIEPSTCTEHGYTGDEVCTVCGEIITPGEIIQLGHDYEVIVIEPTCTNSGYTTYTCTRCGYGYTAFEISSTGHDYETVVTKPTCTEGGYTTYTCTECGDSYVSEETEALGHTTEIQNAKEATCTEVGYTGDGICTVCGEIVSVGEIIPATDHEYEEEITKPTCTEGGYTTYTCTECGDSYVSEETEALGHTTEIQNAKEATTTEEGYTGDEVCTICGEVITIGEVISIFEEDEPSSGTEIGDTGSGNTTDDSTGSNNNTSSSNDNVSNSTETGNEEAEKNSTSADVVTSITKIAKAKKVNVKKKGKKLVIKYKAVSGAVGYRIQIATNKKFTKGKKMRLTKKTNCKFTKLKKNKKYYIRVQAYKVVDGVKKYGKWSSVKKIKL